MQGRFIPMRLQQLLAGLPAARISGPTDIEITSIAYDSRAVKPGGLFVAINGFHTDGRVFIPQALAQGAVAVVVQDSAAEDEGLARQDGVYSGSQPHPPTIVAVQHARTALAPIAAAFYGHP